MRYVCACEGAQNLRIAYDDVDVKTARGLRERIGGHGMWRYAPLLPAPQAFGSRLLVGGTPLLDCGDGDGVRLRIKDETRNPSGSLKDRATELAVAVALMHGYRHVVAASTGNAGASLACIAAAQGIAATIVVPRRTPSAKLAQIAAYGAEVVRVDGDYDDAFAHAVDMSRRDGVYCRNTGYNPFTREGKKTCAFEIAEDLGWRVPDWVVVPTGDGNILSGMAVGFAELLALGMTTSMPRLVAAQSDTSASIARDWVTVASGRPIPSAPTPAAPSTVADSISVRFPRDHAGALAGLRQSRGVAVTVTENEIRRASRHLARRFGLWVEPSSAVGYAAFLRCVQDGTFHAGASVVLLSTGSGLKHPDPWGDVNAALGKRARTRRPKPHDNGDTSAALRRPQ
ncbi:threonine synthase [Pandoraea terrae]